MDKVDTFSAMMTWILENPVELFSVVMGLCFIVLMVYRNIWCWPLGILSSLASIYLFYTSKLYMESILYVFYVFIGIYGWMTWNKERGPEAKVKTWPFLRHLLAILGGTLLSVGLGYIFKTYTDAERPLADSTSTIFSFIANYMEAHKILSSWLFWIGINCFSIWLYNDRGFQLYAFLMVIYFLISIAGYLQWKKTLDAYEPVAE